MLFGTCTLRRDGHFVVFGWSGHASRDKVIRHIERRLAAGARYWVIKPPMLRLVFNQRTGHDHGVAPSVLRMVRDEVGSMVATGEASIFELLGPAIIVRQASGSIDILYQHTICQSPDEPVEDLWHGRVGDQTEHRQGG